MRAEAADQLPDVTDFTAETVAQLFSERDENTVYSPVNLYLALAMLSEATAGDTRKEVIDLMGIDDPRTAANALWKMLYTDGRGKTLAANSVWMGETWAVKQSLADTLAEHYYADTFTVPMGTAEADKAMQSWLNEHTGGLLEEAAGGIQSDPNTVLALMSTLYFEHMWSDRFEEHATSPDVFTYADGAAAEIDFMHAGGTGAWYRGDNFIMSSRSFQDDGGRMLFILPDEGVLPEQLLTDEATVEEILTAGLDNYSRIEWSVPKFDVDSDLELTEQLKALGVEKAFDFNVSDFTPITDEVDVELSQVQHAARVKIDENGCAAAAFTVMMMNAMGAMPPDLVVEMKLDRPFAFVIFNDADLPLFVGTVYTP
jgi:serine protease inhibitor